MLKLQRPTNRSSKQRDRFDFKFSNFQALQVPKGWDRLFVSVVSAETGKTIAKLGKALVKNGSCLWSETISESIYISRDDSSKSYDECLVKFVISTGSTRSGNALGEAVINMAHQTSSRASAAVSQPLKKCSYGTILQLKIQRVNLPRSKIRDEGSKSSDSQERVEDMDHFDVGRKSHSSDHSSNSTNKPPREVPAASSRPLQLDSEEASESATVVINSFSSMEGSYERESSFVENADEYSSHERRGRGSNGEFYSVDGGDIDVDSPSNRSPMHSREAFHNEAAVSRWSMSNVGSSRNLLDAAEDTIEELRAEAKMWERNARKLMIDLDISRKEFSDMSRKQAESGVELSAAYAEQEGLRRQVERVKEELRRSAKNEAAREAPVIKSQSMQKELESEIRYQQDLNDDLRQQLKRSQESNVELVLVLQELEETMEQQRIEMENFMDLQKDLDSSLEENRNLLMQLEKLKSHVQLLDEALRDKSDELEKERESNREILSQVEVEYNCKLLGKEKEISSLEELKGSGENDVNLMREIESLREKVRELEKDCTELTDENLELLFKLKESNKTDIKKCSSFDSITSEHPTSCPSEESEVSDPKCQELKKEVSEEVQIAGIESSLHFAEIWEQMDIAFHLLMKPWHGRSENGNGYLHGSMISDKVSTTQTSVESIRSLLQELNELLQTRFAEADEIFRSHDTEISDKNAIVCEARKKMEESILEVEKMKAESEENNANLMRDLEEKRSEIGLMEADLLLKGKETDFLLQRRRELEAEVSELQQKAKRLEQDLEVAVREGKIASECIGSLQSDVTALRDAVSSHVSANTALERNIKQLERKMHESDNTLLRLQGENSQLKECVSDQEARAHQLRDEKRECLQEMENCKCSVASLQGEIRELKDEMDVQMLDLKRKSEATRKKLLGAQEENKTLLASAATSALETTELLHLNSELKRENHKLREKCLELADQLTEMEKSSSRCTKKVESLQDDFVLRENHLRSELDALVKENSDQKKKLGEEESLRQLLLEKTSDFQSVQKEVERLSKQLSDAREERERISVEVSGEVSGLRAEKAELQASLQETKNKLDAAMHESELKIRDLTEQLAASNQSLDRLMADYDRNLKLVANYRKMEEKLKTDLNDIELKHTISECERQQLTQEMSSLKVQLQSISDLEGEVSGLKGELEECKLDKGKLELALQNIAGDYEELKAERITLFEKISLFEDELEECKRKKSCLEEKLMEMEKDLSEKEIVCVQNEDLKYEANEMKRLNAQSQQRMYTLEVERDECLKKVQALEERNNIHKEGAQNRDCRDQIDVTDGVDANNNDRFVHERQKKNGGAVVARERHETTKPSLETELRELRERYLEMSLKYAEVEGQREDLVMQLRATRTGKRWFS